LLSYLKSSAIDDWQKNIQTFVQVAISPLQTQLVQQAHPAELLSHPKIFHALLCTLQTK